MNPVKVVPVGDRAGIESFISAARRAQACNPRWVEPIHDEIRMTFNPRRAPFMREHVVQPFVAFRGSEPVGRIVATIDSRHIAKFNDGSGFFGFIDAIDDFEVFQALFGAAEQFLKGRGMRSARGPFSLTINHESGLLVHGFDEPHVVRTNHAPPHYARQIEALGYSKAIDLLAYVCRPRESALPERLARILSATEAPPIEFHELSLRSWGRDFRRVLAIYNDAWSDNAWATPVGENEAKLIARMMLPVSRPGWIHIATFKGEDVAVTTQIPDVNEALAGLHGSLWPFGFVRLLWGVHVRGPRRTRAPITGVAKKWRNTRVAAFAISGLVARSIEDARKAGVEEIEYSWMLETNDSALNSVRSLPARHTRTFRIYEKNL
ncbi:MAG TPA: hypothetical protein VMI72_19545 [Roseiarcus sp.]|nr:hypothetical protein [Roseiarcus sp.]